MTLIPGICTQCGATLSVENSKDCMICPYCESPFIVEKAISIFQKTYSTATPTVNICSGQTEDFVIRAGTLEKYNGASVDVVIPDNVTHIGAQAFRECKGLKSVVIPCGVIEIGESAFEGCIGLKSISFPEGVKNILWGAFSNCDALENVILPDSLETIGARAFCGCRNLTSVKIPPFVKYVCKDAFNGCPNLINIIVSDRVYENNKSGFLGSAWERKRCEEKELIEKRKEQEKREKEQEKREKEQQLSDRMFANRCVHCGGQFKGFLKPVCKECGKPKNY